MPRLYTVTFNKVSISAVQDLVGIYLPTSAANFKQVSFSRYWITADEDATLATATALVMRLKFLGQTVTTGSGGSSFTPTPLDPGDAAAKCTARINDTGQATTTGTTTVLDTQGCHSYNGYDSVIQGRPPLALPNNNTLAQALILELQTAPGSALVLSGGLDFIEAG